MPKIRLVCIRTQPSLADPNLVMCEIAQQLTHELDALWRFGLRLTGNEADAQDLVQRTCVKALENADQYENRERLRSWLFRIEHRLWLNVVRSRQTRIRKLQDEHTRLNAQINTEPNSSLSSVGSTASPESAFQLRQMVKAVESLPEKQRTVVLLVCVEGFSYEETANIMDIPIGTIMSRLSRARKTLSEHAGVGQQISADSSSENNEREAKKSQLTVVESSQSARRSKPLKPQSEMH